jgi:poly-beta-1,6-N-acetyl-D-glucosamine synthase
MDASMDNIWISTFWASAAVLAYTYVVYPLALRLAVRFAKPWRRGTEFPRSVSVVVAVRNEETRIAARTGEILSHLEGQQIDGEVLVVSDGSTDGTVQAVRDLKHPLVRLVECAGHGGKAVAVSQGCAQATGEIIVLADTRQTWAPDALIKLLENFADPRVGAVSGDLVLQRSDGALAGVGLYWRLEKWLRRQESCLHSCVGVTGAFCAVRRRLFHPIPTGTILDDMYWPLHVVLAGYRVVHDERVQSFDRLPPRSRDEFRRKVRTLAGNFQLLVRLPAALRPWRNPAFVPLISHKLMRLVIPWAMLGLLVSSGLLPGMWYEAAFATQCASYGCALLGLWSRAAARLPLVSTAAAFLLLNSACALAFFVWLTGGVGRVWRPVRYEMAD